MSILARMMNITKAAAHELLEKLEDPVMMMNQYVRNMQNEIEELQQEIVKQDAAVRGLKLQSDESARLAELYETKAFEALAGGREAEAREALAVKLHHAEKAATHQEWYNSAVIRSAELVSKLEAAKAEFESMQKKRNELINRVQQAEAKSKTSMPNFSSGHTLDGGLASRGFQRMEEKIMQWEARLDLAGHANSKPYGSSSAYPSYGAAPQSAAPADPAKEQLIAEQLEQLRKRMPSE
ncbi:PspA/IM30 family protein [Paenibacillus mendelii]|uniref:PspA/IM30 family protein n=1 Tax=Paenibacillus mendelii TaxID=206163 RepID=A0ABV6JD60_9BACL|nr:PspA/IM30 family protein [Paenibacillus mendelii]MCQ6562421.1 PspA/IM30 family protein [Paenibacillus mendelii]